MKRDLKFESVPYGVLAAGVIGLLLRLWLHSTRDDSGFVTRGHISGVLLLVLTAGVLIGLFLICRYFRQANKYDFNFPASVVSALGSALGAAGIAIVSVTELLAVTTVEGRITALLGLLAAGALGFCAYSRWKGEKVSALFYGVVCVYLMLRLFSMYRLWCTDPQLEEYTFELMALACGAKTIKQACGRYGANQPVRIVETGRLEIPRQNRSYVVAEASLEGTGLKVTHRSVIDNTIEGLACLKDRMFSVQYAPVDDKLYKQFTAMMEEGKRNA
jgi:hypothetical protein